MFLAAILLFSHTLCRHQIPHLEALQLAVLEAGTTVSPMNCSRESFRLHSALIGGRWHDADLAAIDAWHMAQDDQPDRAGALRRLVRMGLSQAVQKKRRKPPQQE